MKANLRKLADTHGTPLLIIDHDIIRRKYRLFKKHMPRVQAYYAVKANSNQEIIKFFTRLPGDFNQPHTTVHILYYCKYLSGSIVKSHESLELSFKNIGEITNWHRDHQHLAEAALNYYKTHFEGENNL